MENKNLSGECLDISDTLYRVNSAVFFLVNTVAEMKDSAKSDFLNSEYFLDGMVQVQHWIDKDIRESQQKLEHIKDCLK